MRLKHIAGALLLVLVVVSGSMTEASAEEKATFVSPELGISFELQKDVIPHLTFGGDNESANEMAIYYADRKVKRDNVLVTYLKRWKEADWQEEVQAGTHYKHQVIHSERGYVYTSMISLMNPYDTYMTEPYERETVNEFKGSMETVLNGLDDMEILPHKEWSEGETVSPEKTWTVEFNTSMDAGSFTKDYVYVVDDHNAKVSGVTVIAEGNTLEVQPPEGGYVPGDYYLYVENGVRDSADSTLKEGVYQSFTVTEDNYFDEEFVELLQQKRLKHVDFGPGEYLTSHENIANYKNYYSGAMYYSYDNYILATDTFSDKLLAVGYRFPPLENYYMKDMTRVLGQPTFSGATEMHELYTYYKLANGAKLQVGFSDDNPSRPIQYLELIFR
ncbi:Ig-like domain-containing protein [Salimicrobium halophilum]|uniref:SbsA Ig-like domain-containing protein n=1 Tax=Salimicrobium halophilum TaxID=86666 RepID=A0A1G8S8C5_9BACI|nr:Ig-like domain-containing protein [Salimicrobium halophilum]SDJ25457.1 hypothetical protein SAMN04490247_1309 [Salimicrobium halophilum]